MEALIAIALICQVNGGMFSTIFSVDETQKECQKELIACYEKSWPHDEATDKSQWIGPLKECVKAR